MRVAAVTLALPALAFAADQAPLLDQVKGWFSQATQAASAYIPQPPAPSAPSIPNPINAGAASVAGSAVERLTLNNYQGILKAGADTASSGIEEWMVLITGGNKTCFGFCQNAETEFNKSVPLLLASKNSPHLAMLNCETDGPLCNAWAVGPPTVMHAFLPQPLPDQSKPATTVRYIALNRTTTSAQEIAAIHTSEDYKKYTPYEGLWHPFDGQLAQFGVGVPVGYAIWAFSLIPSWMFMIGISFISRSFMGRKMPQAQNQAAAPPAQARSG